MENRNSMKSGSKSTTNLRRYSNQKLKFTEISVNNDKEFNELHCKYELFKNGTPNVYADEL